ncbi:MAG: precorrin-6y C5,15-methyltransferase (decarboxylating) subunit CbiE [Bacteroidaceae bacterium]|nr:precorrin-6y C5,15-methyltransferase (decarboxylating) subunit CbiE [Bacteroidaceae bacterium]
MYKCTVIGISDSREQWFSPKIREIIRQGKVFSGGIRHHEIMNDFLPKEHVWIDITIPLSNVFNSYKAYDDIIIFASGDPLFFGFANTIQREVPECKITVHPYFNSIQMLAHRLCLPYHDIRFVSLTGRPWDKFDEALIKGETLIGVLTDKKKTPAIIRQRMREYGYDNYDMYVGECLGNDSEEAITKIGYKEDFSNNSSPTFAQPNCIILQQKVKKEQFFGIPENHFDLLDGRVNMITKAPIRLATLAALNLRNARVFWDIGFCTGSVSIEAKLQCPHLAIESFEIRPECQEIMATNMKRFGTPGINVHIGDFLTTDISTLPVPDAIFIGGHGGKLVEIVDKVVGHINSSIKDNRESEPKRERLIAINSVSEKSHNMMYEAAEKNNFTLISDNRITLNEHNSINIITFAI